MSSVDLGGVVFKRGTFRFEPEVCFVEEWEGLLNAIHNHEGYVLDTFESNQGYSIALMNMGDHQEICVELRAYGAGTGGSMAYTFVLDDYFIKFVEDVIAYDKALQEEENAQ